MKKNQRTRKHKITMQGFSLVEVLLASAIFGLLLVALVGAYLYGQEAALVTDNRIRAALFAEEALEAVRNIRDAGYGNLVNGTYGLQLSGSQWILSGTQDTNDIFTRTTAIATAGTNRKTVTATVTWQQNPQRTGTVSSVTRLTNWLVPKFGDWSNPQFSNGLEADANEIGSKIQTQGNYAYLTIPNHSPTLRVINVTNPSSPTFAGALSIPNYATNIAVSGNYAYVSSADDSAEMKIINISNPSAPSLVSGGIYNAPGTADGKGIYVVGTTVYLVRASSGDNEFVIINAANPSSPQLVGSLNLNAQGNEVFVSGTRAYVASSHDSQEFQVINITTPGSPSLGGFLNLSGTTDATTITVAGEVAYLGQGSTLHTLNISNPSSPAPLGSLPVSGAINDISLNLAGADTVLFLATSHATAEFKAIDVSTPSSPQILGTLDQTNSSALMGIAYSTTHDRVFATSMSGSQDFIVISPQ